MSSEIDKRAARELMLIAEADRMKYSLSSPSAMGYFVTMLMAGLGKGFAYGIMLGRGMKLLSIVPLKKNGKRNPESVLATLDHAIASSGAKYFIITHNHYNNPLTPSPEDILTTNVITEHYQRSSVKFLGHYIVSGYDYLLINDKGKISREYK